MEDDLDTIRGLVKQLYAANLVENRVIGIVLHVVRGDWRERSTLERKDAPLEEDLVLAREQVVQVGQVDIIVAFVSVSKEDLRVWEVKWLTFDNAPLFRRVAVRFVLGSQ